MANITRVGLSKGGTIDGNLTIDGNFTWEGKGGGKGESAIIPVHNYSMGDNTDTRIISINIADFDTGAYYYWGLGCVFEGQIVGINPNATKAISTQIYKCSFNLCQLLDTNAMVAQSMNFSEDAEPTEASSNATDLRAYTTTMSVTYPSVSSVEFNIKTNFTGTEAGEASFYIHGIVRLFHFCNKHDGGFVTYEYSNTETS